MCLILYAIIILNTTLYIHMYMLVLTEKEVLQSLDKDDKELI